ncbi:MAG: hypothetical protein QXE81_00895 [Desulfurococcaceae archaeon]
MTNPVELVDSISKQTRVIIVGKDIFIVKNYASEIGLMKWYIIALSNLTIKVYPFTQDPLERMDREAKFYKAHVKCIMKPEFYIVDYTNLKLIRNFIKGRTYSYTAPLGVHYEIGKCLGKCHEEGWVFGDTKVTNFVFSDTGVYIIDAEQAIEKYDSRYAAWDILVLISTLSTTGYFKALLDEHGFYRVISEILNGYKEGNRRFWEVFANFRISEFKLLTYFLVPFPYNYYLSRKLSDILNNENNEYIKF